MCVQNNTVQNIFEFIPNLFHNNIVLLMLFKQVDETFNDIIVEIFIVF